MLLPTPKTPYYFFCGVFFYECTCGIFVFPKSKMKFPFHQNQEEADGRRVLCGNVVLDKPPEGLMQRVANKVYENSRCGALRLTGFPDYNPVIAALKDSKPDDGGKQYQVTVKKHNRLVILESLASKWLTTEFKDEVTMEIESHNQKYNLDGEYWHEVERWGSWGGWLIVTLY